MPEYTCVDCEYETKIKTHYTRHLNTKKHKTNSGKSINTEPQTYPMYTIKDNKDIPSKNFLCDFCDNTFSTSSHLSRHRKKSCKLKQEQESLEYEFKIDKSKKEAERKEIEANGIAEFQRIVNKTITPQLLKWKGVEATQEIAKSTNSKVIVIGNGDGDLPIILGGDN